MENNMEAFKKIDLPYNQVIPVLGICQKKCESGYYNGTGIPMFIHHYSQ
jgi:hypothetical protein